MNRFRAATLIAIFTVSLPTLGCTWVPLTDEGGMVRVLQASAVTECRKISTVKTTTSDRIIFARSERKVREELEALARNDAAEAGGNAIVPSTAVAKGRQSFDIYRCPDL